MKVEITYPLRSKKMRRKSFMQTLIAFIFIAASIACVIVNVLFPVKVWSPIAVLGMYMVWTFVISPDLVEYNRISQISKLAIFASIMVLLIGLLLSPGWEMTVVPIVCFSGLIIVGTLFFTDYERQRHNAMPMLWMSVLYLIGTVVTISVWTNETNWEIIVMGSVAVALLFLCGVVMRKDLIRELGKRFHLR